MQVCYVNASIEAEDYLKFLILLTETGQAQKMFEVASASLNTVPTSYARISETAPRRGEVKREELEGSKSHITMESAHPLTPFSSLYSAYLFYLTVSSY